MYKVVYSQEKYLIDATKKLENEVNKLKREGWKEQGGVSISRADLGGNFYVAQAMKK